MLGVAWQRLACIAPTALAGTTVMTLDANFEFDEEAQEQIREHKTASSNVKCKLEIATSLKNKTLSNFSAFNESRLEYKFSSNNKT